MNIFRIAFRWANVVREFGAWQNKEAVSGAVAACNKSMAMGPPWTMRHPQSNPVSFFILDIGFEAMFEQSW